MSDMEYAQCMEIVEAVMEYIAMRWTPSMIKRQLREWLPGLSGITASFIMSAAKKEIRKRYGIDPNEYRGKAIAWYEYVIRCNCKMRDKLTAAERLDKLYGLETLTAEDPDIVAQKIRDGLRELDNQVEGVPDDVKNKYERDCKDKDVFDFTGAGQQGKTTETTEKPEKTADSKPKDITDAIEDSEIPKEVLEEINNLKEDEIAGFRKHQTKRREAPD